MENNIELVNPSDMDWSQSKTAPPGCWGKPIFRYDQGRLGTVGHAGPYTTLYKFEPNSFYMPVKIIGAPVEFYVQSGVLKINEQEVNEGLWIRVNPSENPVVFGSTLGATVLAIVREHIAII